MNDRPEDLPKLQDFLADLKHALACVFGRDTEELRNFGFTPERRRKALTTEERAAKEAKAKLTRELRHTKGSRQKENLKADPAPPSA